MSMGQSDQKAARGGDYLGVILGQIEFKASIVAKMYFFTHLSSRSRSIS